MAADLHIHVFEGITEEDLRAFFSSSLGSKYFSLRSNSAARSVAYDKIAHTDKIWVGEVSWLKAMLTEDEDSFVPGPVAQISEIIGEDLPTVDDELISKVVAALNSPNSTGYFTAEPESVREFLEANKGKKVFTVSW